MKVLLLVAIIIGMYHINCLIHPEVLMTETVTFKPHTNQVRKL